MSLKAELKRAYKSHDWVKVCLLHTQIRNFEKNMKGEQDYGNSKQTGYTSQEG